MLSMFKLTSFHAIEPDDIHYVMGMGGSALEDLLCNYIGVSVFNYL